MKKYTKLFLATLCFMSSAPVLADGYKGEAPPLVPVSIPMFNGGFEFTVGALYMKPETTNTNYLGSFYRSGVAGQVENNIHNRMDYAVNPDYNWGFVLGLGYVMPGTANDMKLDWMYFHNDYNGSEYLLGTGSNSSPLVEAVIFPTGHVALSDHAVLNASATMKYAFDAVDLTFGQYLNIGSRLQTRLFTGLRYMRLDSDLSTSARSYDNFQITGPARVALEQNWTGKINSSFNGLGPLTGIKADYYMGTGFSLSGMIDAALLVGQLGLNGNAQHSVYSQATAGSAFVLDESSNHQLGWDSQNVIAPGFDAKFGLNYKYQFNNGTLLGVELGYQVTKYLDVVEELDRDDAQDDTNRWDSNVTNFRLAGPYLTMNVKI